MANEIKVYYPDTIEDQPLTSVAVEAVVATGSSSAKTASETVTIEPASTFPPRPIPQPVVAKEVISNSLDTQSRQILSSYTFGRVGAIQVGEYVDGVSGDIRISPDGIVARNSAGVTTISIDGTTGNATFLGTVSAGSVISASVSANLITGTIVDAQIATIAWAKITSVAIVNADIVSLSADKITTGSLSGINIAIGTSNSIFKADSNGIYLGNATYGSAPFRVSMSGAVTASSLTLTNASIGSGSSYTGQQIANAYIGNLSAEKITTGTLTGITIISSDGDDKIVLNSGDTIDFYNGITKTGVLRGGNSNGVVADNCWMVAEKTYGFIASSNDANTDFFKFFCDAGGNGIIELPANNKIYFNKSDDTSLFDYDGTEWNFGRDVDLTDHNIKGINQITFNDSDQYINTDSNDMRVHVGENFEVYQGSTIKAIIDANIWTKGTYSQGCSAFIGEPFNILQTIVSEKKDKISKGDRFESLDHSKVHKVLKTDFVDKKGVKHNGMSLSGLVSVQNEAILLLKQRLEVLEGKVLSQ